jgi:ribonucleotide reductase beta subunit family protein with ferritin-like domain
MITLSKKQKVILSYFRDGKAKKVICRDEKIHWKTANRYISEYQKYRTELLSNGEVSENEIIEKIVEKPKYDVSNQI